MFPSRDPQSHAPRLTPPCLTLDRKTIEQTIVREVQASNSHVVIGIALLAVVLIISPVIIILVRMITRTLQVGTRR